MTARAQLCIAAAMVLAYALDAALTRPRIRHSYLLASRDCVVFERCWIR